MAQLLQRADKFVVALPAHHLQELVAGEDQLADHGHQVLEQVDANADGVARDRRFDGRLTGALGGRRRRGGGGRLLDVGRSGVGRCERPHGVGRLGCRRFGLAPGCQIGGDRFVRHGLRAARRLFRRRGRVAALGEGVEAADEFLVVAGGLGLGLLERAQQPLDAIEGFEDQRDRVLGHGKLARAEFAKHFLGGMGHRFETRQPEKPARALDGVDDAEDHAQQLRVVGLLLEFDQLNVEDGDAF